MRTAQNSCVFGIRCFEIINPGKNNFSEVRGPKIRFFGGVDRAVLSRIAAPSQLRAGPAREIGKNRVLASSAELRPSVYSWFGFQNLREFPGHLPNLLKNHGNLLIFFDFSSIRTGRPLASPRRGTPFFSKTLLCCAKYRFSKLSSFGCAK